MADHDLLLHIVAAIPHGSKQGRRRLDAPVCIKSFTMEQAVYVVALVRFSCPVFSSTSQVLRRSIGVDVQYFLCAVIAMLVCSFAPSRAPALLSGLTISAAIASVTLSIQSASDLVFAPAGSELRVPMPVIGIDWMQVARCDRAVIDVLSAVDAQEGAMSSAVDNFYSSLYLRCDAPHALLCILAHDTVAVLCGAACRGSWASPSPTLRPKVITRMLSRLPTAGQRRRGRCCSLPSLYFLSCL